MPTLIANLIFWQTLLAWNHGCHEPVAKLEQGPPLAIIANPRATSQDLIGAIARLQEPTEKPEFWVGIVNDPNCCENRRGYCALELFRRHIRPGMTLGDVQGILNGAFWLKDQNVFSFVVMCGSVPVSKQNGDGSIFAIHIFNEDGKDAIYLCVEGDMTQEELVMTLKKKDVDPRLRNRKIYDVYPQPDRFHAPFWFWERKNEGLKKSPI